MDIAEIREKAKLLKDREEEAEAKIQSEPAQYAEGLDDTDTPPSIDYISEVAVQTHDEPVGLEEENRSRNSVQEKLEPPVPDVQKPEPSVHEEVNNSDRKEVAEGEVEAIIFSLDAEDYGVDIHQVKEVIKVRDLTNVPKAPRDIMGVISLRGVVIPVMNLRGRFGMPIKNSGERIIIVRDGAGLLGLLVDTVRHVIRVPEKSIEPAPSINTIDGELIRGIGRYKGGMFILIDMQKMLELK